MKQVRLLIARIDRIGDVVLSTPIPREVKRAYPDCFIAVLVQSYTRDIYLNNPYVDEIILYDKNDKPCSFWKLVKSIRELKCNYAFMLLPNERLNWILFLSNIANRIGVGRKLYQFLSLSKFVNRKKCNPIRHEADYCLDMVRKIEIEPKSIFPEIHLTDDENSEAIKIRKELAPNGELIVGINTTHGGSSPNFSPERYKPIAETLVRHKDIVVLITDLNPPDELRDIPKVKYPNIGNSLRESIVMFSAIDVLISSSTGPMHICAALNVPTISLFCPLPACSPELWGPLGNNSDIILPERSNDSLICTTDPHKCNFTGECNIDPEVIINKVYSFLNKN
jgi:heptosyltransferase-2